MAEGRLAPFCIMSALSSTLTRVRVPLGRTLIMKNIVGSGARIIHRRFLAGGREPALLFLCLDVSFFSLLFVHSFVRLPGVSLIPRSQLKRRSDALCR
jgi:hypothetical protein